MIDVSILVKRKELALTMLRSSSVSIMTISSPSSLPVVPLVRV